MSDSENGQAQAQRIGGGYARLLSGIVKDFGVSRDAAASIVARAGHWSMTCDACGTRYGPDGTCSACEPAEAMAAWANPDPLDVLRRVFMATPSSIERPDHAPEDLWRALGYDVEDGATDTDCQMERNRAEVDALLVDVNRVLGCALPLPPHVPCEDTDEDEPCERCKATTQVLPPGLLIDSLDGTGPEATAGEAFGEGD